MSPAPTKRRLLIVWWSVTGASRALAEHARAAAAAEDQVDVACRRCDHTNAQHLFDAHAYLFVAPENLATLAGMMKDFFDRTYYAVDDRVAGRRYGAIISAGSDGQGAARQLTRIVSGWRLTPIAAPLIVITAAQSREQILAPKRLSPEQWRPAAELGATLAAGLAAGIF